MSVTKEMQRAEAIARLKLLNKKFNLMNECVKAFEKDGSVWASETAGILYEINDKVKALIAKFEDECGGLVYHVIRSNTNIGLMYSFFYVNKHSEEWQCDCEDFEFNEALVYVWNETYGEGEFGYIRFIGANGGLQRTA